MSSPTGRRSIDARGRPTINPAATYKDKAALVFPTGAGGHNWPPMAFNPQTRLVYIPARESGMVMTPLPGEYQWKPGQTNGGHRVAFSFFVDLMSPAERKEYDAVVASYPGLPDPSTHEFLIAYDPVKQEERWRLPLGRAELAGGGVLTTAGNLVVQGTSAGKLVVYRADTGAVVKEIDVGTGIMAAPVSYEIDSEQYIAVLAGFGGAMAPLYPAESAAHRYQNYGRLLTFKLGGTNTPLPPKRERCARHRHRRSCPARHQRCSAARCRHCSSPICVLLPRRPGRSAPVGVSGSVPPGCAGARARSSRSCTTASWRSNGMASFADVLSPQDVAAIQAFLVQGQTALRNQEQTAK